MYAQTADFSLRRLFTIYWAPLAGRAKKVRTPADCTTMVRTNNQTHHNGAQLRVLLA